MSEEGISNNQVESELSLEPSSAKIDALFDVNRFAEAERLIFEKLANDPEDTYWLFMLARAYLAQDKLADAEDTLFSSLRSDPLNSWSYYLLSLVSHHLLNFVQELNCAKKAVEIESEESTFLQRLSEAHIQNGEINKARNVLHQLTQLEPDSVEAFSTLGDLEFEIDNFVKAEDAYRQALKYEPENISLLNDFARSLMGQKGKLRESIDVLFNIIQLDPTNETIAKNLHLSIREWIDKNTIKGRGKKSLSELPQPLQYFYNDYKSRSSIFEAWGKFVWTFVWIIVLVGMTFLFSLLEK